MKSLTIFKGVPALRQSLKEFKITSKSDAIKFIHLKSILSQKDLGERLANEAKDYLLNKCVDCDVYESDGLALTKITPKLRVYNDSDELKFAENLVESLIENLAVAKEKLEAVQNKVGFVEHEGQGKPYFKVKL